METRQQTKRRSIMDHNTVATGAQPPRGEAPPPEKAKFAEAYGKSTIGQIGEQMGIDPFVWGFMNINKDEPITPERFEQMVSAPYMAYALPRAAVVRHSEQLKTMERQFLSEQDPAKKEQIKANYDALSGQINILRDYIENGPDEGMVADALKNAGIDDPAAVKQAMNRMKGVVRPGGGGASGPATGGPAAANAMPAGGPQTLPATPNSAPGNANPAAPRRRTAEAIIQKYLESAAT
jgi:hypothetical protein